MRILIVDDHEVVREGLRQVLSSNGADRVDSAGNLGEALRRIRENPYSAVVMDLSLPDGNGLDALREIRTSWPRLPVLVVSMHPEEIWTPRAMRAGANGYLNKSTSAAEIVQAVRQVVAGGRYFSRPLAQRPADPLDPAGGERARLGTLSKREFEVLRLLGAGRPVGDVARVLGISVKTVSTHREHILRKLGFANNMELIRHCLRLGLLGDPEIPEQV